MSGSGERQQAEAGVGSPLPGRKTSVS